MLFLKCGELRDDRRDLVALRRLIHVLLDVTETGIDAGEFKRELAGPLAGRAAHDSAGAAGALFMKNPA